MPTLLDNVLEKHDGPEPRVLTADVQAILARVIRPDSDETGDSVMLIAEKARVSTRTVYRCLNPDEAKLTINMDLADRLCIAADSHLSNCRLVWPGGIITEYTVLRPNGG